MPKLLPCSAGEALAVADQDALALQADPPAVREIGQRLVDRLTGRADQLGQLLLGQIVGDQDAVVGGAALAGGRAPILGTLLGAVFIQLMGYTLIANGISDEMTLIVTAAIIALAVWLQRGRRA